jgi:hypothetical protein
VSAAPRLAEALRRRWPDLLCLALLLAAVLWMLGPMVLEPAGRLIGHPDHPGGQGSFIFQWTNHRLVRDGQLPFQLFSPYLHAPEGQPFELKVAFSLSLVIEGLFQWALGLHRGQGAALASILWLNGAALFALIRWRGAQRSFALAAALVFALGPYASIKLDQGFDHKIVLFGMPLFAFAVLRLTKAQSKAGLVLLGIGSAALIWSYPPYLGYCVLALLPLTLAELSRRWGGWRARLLLWTTGLGALAAIVLGALALAGGWQLPATLELGLDTFLTEGGYLEPGRFHRWFPYVEAPMGAPAAFLRTLPLGLPVMAGGLAIAAAWRDRQARSLLLGAGILLTLMAGPWLLHDGELVTTAGHPVPLPLRLVGTLPLSSVFRMPIRMLPAVQVALLLAGAGLLASLPRARWTAPVVAGLSLVLVLESWLLFPEYRSLRSHTAAIPSFCGADGALAPGALYHLPVDSIYPHHYGYLSALCDRPMMNGDLFEPPVIPAPDAEASPEDRQRFLAEIAAAGVVAVVLHPRELQDGGAPERAWLEASCGPPLEDTELELLAYPLPSPR